MNRKFNFVMVFIILGIFIVPIVNAEQVISNTTITISASNSNSTIHLASQFGGQDFNLADLQNGSQVYSFQFVGDLLCQQDIVNANLQNYTEVIASACAIDMERLNYSYTIYDTNTQLSFEKLALQANQSKYDQLIIDYTNLKSTSDAQQVTISSWSDYEEIKNQRMTWGIVGLLVGVIGMWYYYNHGKQSRSSSKQPSALGGFNKGDNLGSYPKNLDSDSRLNPEIGKDQKL